MEDKYAIINSIKVRYWDFGDGEPLLFIHGLGGFIETWLPAITHFKGKYRILTLDLPGSGKSAEPLTSISNYYQFNANFLKDFLSHLNIDKATVIGHSGGAGIALLYSAYFPQDVKKVVAINAASVDKEVHWNMRLLSINSVSRMIGYLARKNVHKRSW